MPASRAAIPTLPAIRLLALVALAMVLRGSDIPPSASASGRSAAPQPGAVAQDWYLVIDRAGVLDDGQQQSAIDDAYRLFLLGISIQIVTENTGFSQEQADFRANELRLANRIESAPGRDDGILIYVAVDPGDRSSVTLTISVGSRTLPNGGLTRGDIETIRETIVSSQLAAGHPARAIVYGIREMIYQLTFTPSALEPLPDGRERLGTVLSVAAPVIALACSGWILARRRTEARLPFASSAAVAATIGALAVAWRSELGVASAIALGLLVTWQAIRFDTRQASPSHRQIRATPRPARRPPVSQRPAKADNR